MAILADFSPFLEPMGLDEAYLDATGFESLYGSIRQMAIKIKGHVREELGLIASAGIATCKVVAKVASDESKPDGLIEVPAGGEAAFLSPLAIDKLPGVGKKTEQVLRGLGISTIGKLARMPPESLKIRFGVFGVTLHRYTNGLDDRTVSPHGDASSISRETTFARDTGERTFCLVNSATLPRKLRLIYVNMRNKPGVLLSS
jgi:DNA polymerase-4